MYQDDRQSAYGTRRVGDYQGVYSVEDDALTPDQIFAQIMEGLKNTIPQEIAETTYYHITQFNNVT
jgi:hypothetical protein